MLVRILNGYQTAQKEGNCEARLFHGIIYYKNQIKYQIQHKIEYEMQENTTTKITATAMAFNDTLQFIIFRVFLILATTILLIQGES